MGKDQFGETQCGRQTDESHDAYLARADVCRGWSWRPKINDLQAYVALRGAQLTSDDKKKLMLDADSSLEGTLTGSRV